MLRMFTFSCVVHTVVISTHVFVCLFSAECFWNAVEAEFPEMTEDSKIHCRFHFNQNVHQAGNKYLTAKDREENKKLWSLWASSTTVEEEDKSKEDLFLFFGSKMLGNDKNLNKMMGVFHWHELRKMHILPLYKKDHPCLESLAEEPTCNLSESAHGGVARQRAQFMTMPEAVQWDLAQQTVQMANGEISKP